MRKVKYSNINIGGEILKELYVFYDNKGNLALLPLLFSINLAKTGEVFVDKIISTRDRQKNSEFVTEKSLEKSEISLHTESTYLGHILKFLEYLEGNSLPGDELEHRSELVDDEDISYFLNGVYPKNITTLSSVKGMKSALTAYFNFLTYLGISKHKSIKVDKETRSIMLTKESENFQIKYIKSNIINELLLATKTKADNLIIQCGYKLGLRARECAGLILTGDNGLKELIEEYKDEEENIGKYPIVTEYFLYMLRSKYTKGGKSRLLYIPRSMMRDIESYIETERADIVTNSKHGDSDTLILCAAKNYYGKPISTKHASTVFRRLKKAVTNLEEHHTFHCLRHTFATQLYDNKINKGEGKNEALRHVAIRLGHSLDRNGNASTNTVRYIEMRDYMLIAENNL
jgi:site-specific recombinase XerD